MDFLAEKIGKNLPSCVFGMPSIFVLENEWLDLSQLLSALTFDVSTTNRKACMYVCDILTEDNNRLYAGKWDSL